MRHALVGTLLLAALLCSCGATLPEALKEEVQRAPPGTATVVFFTDFECPFCRRTHAKLAAITAARPDRVRVVLKHVPIPAHPHARDAARASICGERLLQPDAAPAFDHALFAAPDLSVQACEEMAVARGVDRAAFEACVASPATDAEIEADEALFERTGGDGVPLLVIGSRTFRSRLVGEPSAASLEDAIDAALEQQPTP